MLCMAQLEDRIKAEIQSRESLTKAYEKSLNRGINTLNKDTTLLAENPLVKEISIVVAKQLLTKSSEDPNSIY